MRCPIYDEMDKAYRYWLKLGDEMKAYEVKLYRDEHHRTCPVCQDEMQWAQGCPPNPELSREELEAA